MSAAAPAQDAGLDLDEIRAEAVRAITAVLLAAVVYLLLLIAAQPGRWQHEPISVVVLTAITMVATNALLSRGIGPAAAALLIGTTATITTAVFAFGNGFFACAYSAVVLVAAMLLGWRHATAIGTVAAAIVLYIAGQAPQILAAGVVEMALLLIAGDLVLAWLLSRPVYTTLGWYWSSYRLAEEKTEEARARQGELARLSKSLEEACIRLEVANEELERARKAAVEARRIKADFAAAISHELRTPLNLIIGFSEMMVIAPHTYQGERLPEGYRGDIEAIYRNACHLSGLVDDVLDLAEVEAHRMALEKEWAALDRIVDEAIATVATLYKDRGLSVQSQIPRDLPSFYVDRTRVRQILINLLNNAARFTVSGGATVRAECNRDGEEVVISVEDTGIGIPPEELPSVFKEFHHSGDPHPGPFGGRGLGLAICRRFVELHGGSIWVESIPGQGSTFSFSLPLNPNVVGAPAREEWETWARLPDPHLEPTVAVLSSDDVAVDVFRRYLDGYRVERVGDIGQARRLATRTPLRALVVATPNGRTGPGTEPAQLPGVPVVTCPLRTRANANPDLQVAKYLVKPVDREELSAALSHLPKKPIEVAVVDDDPEMVRLLSRMLRSLSRRYRVVSASGGAEALELFRRRRPDVVLLDLLMPGVDGYQVVEAMKRDVELADVPVIVVTARGAERELVTADEFAIRRPGGLSVGEVTGYLRAVLEITSHSAWPEPTGAPAE